MMHLGRVPIFGHELYSDEYYSVHSDFLQQLRRHSFVTNGFALRGSCTLEHSIVGVKALCLFSPGTRRKCVVFASEEREFAISH